MSAQMEVSSNLNKLDVNSKKKEDGANGDENPYEHHQIREIQKNIRNINKKLANMQKLDTIISSNPNMSLDQLVAARKINTDQKAQALNKPILQASAAQLEEQLAMFRKMEDEFRRRIDEDTDLLRSAHTKELQNLEKTLRAQMLIESKTELRQSLLVLSKFLRAAAARRQMDNEEAEESKAFEGVLLLMYGGDNAAVDTAEKLIAGTEDLIPSTEGSILNVSYESVKQMALTYSPSGADDLEQQNLQISQEQPTTQRPLGSDPTLVNAGLTELDSQTQLYSQQGTGHERIDLMTNERTNIGLANSAAVAQWEHKAPDTSELMSESWVEVSDPRDVGEVEESSRTVAGSTSANWADEAPDSTPASNDGFREVHHGRGRSRGGYPGDHRGGRARGGFRGEGGRGRGGYRGDGPRGRGRGGRARDSN